MDALSHGADATGRPPRVRQRADTPLRVREVVVGAEGSRPQTNRAYYTADGETEVIPPRFGSVGFMNDKVGFAFDGQKYYRVRFDVTGATPAVIEAMPYHKLGAFDVGRRRDDALAVRRVWYGGAGSTHKVQYVYVDDVLVLDERGEPTATVLDGSTPKCRSGSGKSRRDAKPMSRSEKLCRGHRGAPRDHGLPQRQHPR